MAKKETIAKASIYNFKRCIRLMLMLKNGIDGIYAPPSARYEDGMPIVFVSYDPKKPFKKIPINQILGYDYIEQKVKTDNNYGIGIDYTLFDYTKHMKSIDDVIKNSAKKQFNLEDLK